MYSDRLFWPRLTITACTGVSTVITSRSGSTGQSAGRRWPVVTIRMTDGGSPIAHVRSFHWKRISLLGHFCFGCRWDEMAWPLNCPKMPFWLRKEWMRFLLGGEIRLVIVDPQLLSVRILMRVTCGQKALLSIIIYLQKFDNCSLLYPVFVRFHRYILALSFFIDSS